MITYLALPTSHIDPEVVEARYQAALRAAAKLTLEGKTVYSLVVHFHQVARTGLMPYTWNYWRKIGEEMMDVCGEIAILRLEGWDVSVGVADERAYMTAQGKPEFFVDPD